MKLAAGMLAAALILGATAAQAQQKRELGAHQHGHGTLKIAIEGQSVEMELRAPGDDIVGFEHAARTAAQKTAVEKAEKQLSEPLKLFVLPAAAQCTVKEAKAALEQGSGPKSGDHSEFLATYKLECANMKGLASIRFEFFKVFPKSDELDVTIVSDKGQKSYEVSRKKSQINLSGLM